jgi:hypothetical protein
MSPRDYILPYFTVVHHLLQGEGADREELMQVLKQAGAELSLRSFQRLLESLRADLGLSIIYDPTLNKYHLDNSNPELLSKFFRYCKWMLEAGFVLEQLKTKSDQDNFFIPPANGTAGAEWLQLVSEAIDTKCLLRIVVRTKSDDHKKMTVLPVALKQEEEYWMLLAWQPKKSKWREINMSKMLAVEKKSPAGEIDHLPVKDAIRQFRPLELR